MTRLQVRTGSAIAAISASSCFLQQAVSRSGNHRQVRDKALHGEQDVYACRCLDPVTCQAAPLVLHPSWPGAACRPDMRLLMASALCVVGCAGLQRMISAVHNAWASNRRD